MLEMMVHNAHYLFKNYAKSKMSITDFKEQTVKWLVGEIKLPNYLLPIANFHYFNPIPPSDKKENPTRKCITCNKKGKRKESRYICAYCDDQPALCVYPCFAEYHINLGV